MEFLKRQKQFFKDVLVDGIKAIVTVEDMHDEDLIQFRKEKCYSCPFYNAKFDQCGVCKCIVEAKTKLKVNKNPLRGFRPEITHCPVGFWDDVETANIYRKIDGKPLLEE